MASIGRNLLMFRPLPLTEVYRLDRIALVGAGNLVGLRIVSVLSVGHLVVHREEKDLSLDPCLETECVLTSARVSVLRVLEVCTLTVRRVKDRLHPDVLTKVLLHQDGKEERIISEVAVLLPAVVVSVGALLLTEKQVLIRSPHHASCS